MKFLLILLLFLASVFNLFAQDKEIENIMEFLKNKQIAEARALSDKLIQDKNYVANSRLWFYRAVVYHNIYDSQSLKDSTTIFSVNDSYFKTLELDKEKKYYSETMKGLGIIANQFVYEGIQYFNKGNFPQAYKCFVKNLEIGRMPSVNQLDTIVLYNAAISAEKSGNLEDAAKYYEELAKMNYGGVNMYNDLVKVLRQLGQEERFLRFIETGIRSYPKESYNLYSEVINYYLEKNDYPKALEYTATALKVNDSSAGLHFLYGSLNESFSKNDIAEAEYKRTIELDNKFVDAYFNLGSMYYNIGVDLLKKAMTKDEKAAADKYYTQALELFEKVLELTPDNQETIKILSNLYGYFKMTDKQNLMQTKIK